MTPLQRVELEKGVALSPKFSKYIPYLSLLSLAKEGRKEGRGAAHETKGLVL